ncbi:MAG: hypothetical protein E7619_05800 [Ruminococcaceae bacterium]|nr:hypothetical protein [Oscillospiraceae bacterium]
MKKRILAFLLCAVTVALSLPCVPYVRASEEDGGLHSIYELNTEEGELDSHAGVTHLSTLEIDRRNSYRIDNGVLIKEGDMWYPRIKRLSSGKYILFFQDGRWGPNIYCSFSDDGTNWEEPTVLFASHLTANDNFRRHYATADAIELANGDIVVGAIFHAVSKDDNSPKPSRFLMTEKGVVTKYSTDGGRTWSEQQIVYHGRVWEPSFLQLPDGTVQMYITHSAPKDAIYRQKMGNHVSSGVAMITSKDNGRTWSPMALTYPYIAKRIAQQKIYVNENGVQILTDQMPVAILLHDNETIVMAVESLPGEGIPHQTSIIRSHDFFDRTLEENEDGPEDRDNMIHQGAGPYIAQFPSGEIALSMAVSAKQKIYLGNEKGTEFYLDREYNPLIYQSRGMWGDLFVTSSHTLMTSSGDTIVEPGVKSNLHTTGIGVTRLVLDHRIDAKTASMKVDGNTADWFDNTDALFVGSISQAQTSIRVAHDEDNVYFLFEQLDYDITYGEKFEFSVSDGSSTYRVTADTDRVKTVQRVKGSGSAVLGFKSAVKLYGTKDDQSDTDEGYVIEFSIPKKYFTSTELRVFMKMYNTDGGNTYAWDGFNGLKEGDQSTWHMVRLSDRKAMTEKPAETEPVTTAEPVTEPVTTAPVTTEPPVTTTEPPVTTTEPPVTTTEPPVTTTEAPVTTTRPATSADSGDSYLPIVLLVFAAVAIVIILIIKKKKQ